MVSELLTGLLGGWFILSAWKQCPPGWQPRLLRDFPMFGLLPNWALFSSNYAVLNYDLRVRYHDENGKLSSWRSMKVARRGREIPLLWVPVRRVEKAYLDVALKIIQLRLQKTPDVEASLPYRICLRLAREQSIPDGASAIQFGYFLFANNQSRDRRLLFLSNSHPISQ